MAKAKVSKPAGVPSLAKFDKRGQRLRLAGITPKEDAVFKRLNIMSPTKRMKQFAGTNTMKVFNKVKRAGG